MKHIISFFALILLISIFVVACKKESAHVKVQGSGNTVNLTSIDNDLNRINAKYGHHTTAAAKTTNSNKRAWATAGADAVAAGATIAKTWSWCSTPLGGLAAGFCTVLAATVASVAMYNGCPGSVTDTTGESNSEIITNQKNEIIANVDHYDISDPYSNPYESIGAQHNDWVKVLCEKSTPLPLSYSTLTYAESDFSSDQLSYIAYDTFHVAYSIASYVTPSTVTDLYGNPTITPMINYYFANESNLQNIMSEFADGFSQITDVSSAMSFVNDYENYFLNTQTNLADYETASLLNSFAVAKYSFAMWDDAYSVN